MDHDKNKSLINIEDPKSIQELLDSPTSVISEFLTGLLSSEFNLKYSAGKLVQAIQKGKFLEQLGRELNELKQKGKIKEDYFASNNSRATLLELLKFLDEDVPDEEKFKALKSIFFYSVTKGISEAEELFAYQLFQICKELSSGEILLLRAVYNIIQGNFAPGVVVNINETSKAAWLRIVAQQLGHQDISLMEFYEESLMNRKILTAHIYPDRSGIRGGPDFRLTSLGKNLCGFITKYP